MNFEHYKGNHGNTYVVEWAREFQSFDQMEGFPGMYSVSIQTVNTKNYYSLGLYRQDETETYFYYTLSGTGGFGDQNGDYRVPAGQGCLMEIANPHMYYYYPPEESGVWRFLAVRMSGAATRVMARDLIQKYGPVFTLSLESPIIQRLLAYESREYGLTRVQTVDASECVMELLIALASAAREEENRNPATELVQKAMYLMNADTEATLSVSELASQTGTSREHLARSFQQCLGTSPRQLLLEHKMRRACFLLKGSALPVKQIADQLGYTTCTSFTQSFRRVMQVTPHRFRRYGTIPLTAPPLSNSAVFLENA